MSTPEEVNIKPKSKKGKKVLIIILAVFLVIIIALVSAFFILTYMGKIQFHKDDTHITNEDIDIEDDSTITYNDKKYVLNENIVSMLVIGVDRENINENLGIGNNGQADVILVATIDTKTKKTSIIPISRETLTDVNIYTTDGGYAGTKKEQICLAYAYGNSAEESSKNVLTSVKRMLYGVNINSYVAIELDGIAKLSDLVGGVPVTCLNDFRDGATDYKKGQQINLKGELAVRYIQHRDNDLESNIKRMERQKQFLSELINQTGNAVMNDYSKLPSYYTELSPYFSSNVSLAQIVYLAQECLTMNFGDSIDYKIIDGDISFGEEWAQFKPDEESVLQAVIDTFYLPKE